MLRKARLKSEPEVVNGFRLRGREVTRLEGFSDAVFGFSLTLLVVSLEVPKTYSELIGTMKGFFAFAICFAILAMIWNSHYVFSRRFGLDDGFVRFLTCVLLFIVLVYVYPLKFLFNLFINGMILGGKRGQLTVAEGRMLFVIYGLGFAAVYLALTLLYLHAYRRRHALELNAVEKFDTRWEIYGFLCMAAVGLFSALFASIAAPGWIDYAGFVYFSLWPIMWLHGTTRAKRRRSIQAQAAIETAPQTQPL
jgi:uncharacterized membrane protein